VNFKVGTATAASDNVAILLESATTTDLATGLEASSVSSLDQANAAAGMTDTAIDRVADLRAGIGANQNRLEFAFGNLTTVRENTEHARSTLLDLDVAQGMSQFILDISVRALSTIMLAKTHDTQRALLLLFDIASRVLKSDQGSTLNLLKQNSPAHNLNPLSST